MIIWRSTLSPTQRKAAAIAAGVFACYTLFGFLGAPLLVKRALENNVAQRLARVITVENVRINPFTLTAILQRPNVRESDGRPFFSADRLVLDLQAVSLFKRALVVRRFELHAPRMHLVRLDRTRFNFSDLAGGDRATSAPEARGVPPFALAELRVQDGRLRLEDRFKDVNHDLAGIELTLHDLSAVAGETEGYAGFSVAGTVNGAALALNGKARPFAAVPQAAATLDLQGLALPVYLPYVTLPENLGLRSARLDAALDLRFEQAPPATPSLVLAGTARLASVELVDGSAAPLLKWEACDVRLAPTDLLGSRFQIAGVTFTAPELHLTRLADGTFNLPAAGAAATRDGAAAPPPRLSVDRLDLHGGTVHFADFSNASPFQEAFSAIDLFVTDFDTRPGSTATFGLQAVSGRQAQVALEGRVTASPLAVDASVSLANLPLAAGAPYYQERVSFLVTAGRLDLHGALRYAPTATEPRGALDDLGLQISGLEVVAGPDRQPLAALDGLSLAGGRLDWQARRVRIDTLNLAAGRLNLRRDASGVVNLARAVGPPQDPATPPKESSAPAPGGPPSADGWQLELGQLDLHDVGVHFEDRLPGDPVAIDLDRLRLSARGLSNRPDSPAEVDLALRWAGRGQVTAKGRLAPVPLAVDLDVSLDAFDLRPLQPYLASHAALIVTQGDVRTSGQLSFRRPEGDAPTLTYAGTAAVTDFKSLDSRTANAFVNWSALNLDALHLSLNPNDIVIGEVALADFFARVIVNADGSVNLLSVLAPPAPAAETPQPAAADAKETTAVRIDVVTLYNGTLDFSDRLIQPNFNAVFHDLGGRVSGLVSAAGKRADVDLEGRFARHAPLNIGGRLHPFGADRFADLTLSFKGIELSPFTPYTGKYLGYVLEKGKLSLNLRYLLERDRLQGQNRIFLDQFTLGSPTASPHAVKLPIKLAVALLKDRNGRIEIDLPVEGDLADPQFSLGRIVLTMFKNLIVKIVSSPFAALGAVFGGGEELSFVDFAAGRSAVDAQGHEKLATLAKILFERPQLTLEITGEVDPEKDRAGLQQMRFEALLKAEKVKQLARAGSPPADLEAVVVSAEERPLMVAAAYQAADFPKPRDADGNLQTLPPEEMEKLLVAFAAISDADLRQLAHDRAQSAQTVLLESRAIGAQRVFVLEPRIAGTETETTRSRASFKLK